MVRGRKYAPVQAGTLLFVVAPRLFDVPNIASNTAEHGAYHYQPTHILYCNVLIDHLKKHDPKLNGLEQEKPFPKICSCLENK